MTFHSLIDRMGSEMSGFHAKLGNMCDYFSLYFNVDTFNVALVG